VSINYAIYQPGQAVVMSGLVSLWHTPQTAINVYTKPELLLRGSALTRGSSASAPRRDLGPNFPSRL